MIVNSRLGLEDTLPFGKFKGQTVEGVYKQNASYLMWLRDARANPKPDESTGKMQPPNKEFFEDEVLKLLNSTIMANPAGYSKYEVWPDVGAVVHEPDDTPFPPALKLDDLYNGWGAF